jgi:serine/threonine-protein kinase
VPTFRITEAIIGMKAKDAKKRLEELGFAVDEIKVGDEAPKDTVVGTDPPVGSQVQPGGTITLYVSEGDKGPPHEPRSGRGKHEGEDND